jgi:N-acetylmuramoyl-L-alanine amidase-like protein
MAPLINKSLRLPPTAYFPTRETKTGIALHHTVGGGAKSTINYWAANDEIVGTAYIIDRDGTIYEVFEPTAWAWQFGLRWAPADKIAFEKRFIGIEIASEGALVESNGQLYCFGTVSSKSLKPRGETFDCGRDYRGYRYFDKYEPAQMDSLCGLLDWLCGQFGVPKQVPANPTEYRGEALKRFSGIIGHTMVRLDKTDPLPDAAFWDRLGSTCALTFVDDIDAAPSSHRGLDDLAIQQLFQSNASVINAMNVSAGSMVKGLIMELERNNRATYIRLRDPVAGGHAVGYDLVQGDAKLVERIAKALGFKSVTASRLEVRNA